MEPIKLNFDQYLQKTKQKQKQTKKKKKEKKKKKRKKEPSILLNQLSFHCFC